MLGVVAAVLIVAVASGVPMNITSTAMTHEGTVPSRYTCDGANVSPPLAWTEVPAGTKSFALVVTDPDAPDPKAPKTTWVHWVLYDVPAATHELGEGASRNLPAGAREGKND